MKDDYGYINQVQNEMQEAIGQIENARRCLQTLGLRYQPGEFCQGGHAPIKDDSSHKKILAHRLREAIGNLKDCLRFVDEEQP